MVRNTFSRRVLRALMAVAVGGSAFQLSSCDPNVRSALLSGLEDTTTTLSGALITAFFLTLDSEDSTPDTF